MQNIFMVRLVDEQGTGFLPLLLGKFVKKPLGAHGGLFHDSETLLA